MCPIHEKVQIFTIGSMMYIIIIRIHSFQSGMSFQSYRSEDTLEPAPDSLVTIFPHCVDTHVHKKVGTHVLHLYSYHIYLQKGRQSRFLYMKVGSY